MLFSYLIMTLLIIPTLGKDCDNIKCTNILDEVCGLVKLKDGTQMIKKYQNICHMRREACKQDFVEINQVSNKLCDIKKEFKIGKFDGNVDEGRRFSDTITGAYQACNHTCPTHCPDIYSPSCAKIYYVNNRRRFTFRTMINHCHIDLYSCVTHRNVTILPLSECFANPLPLAFMRNVAMLKSMKFIDALPSNSPKKQTNRPMNRRKRDVSVPDVESEISLKNHLKEIVRRLFQKFQKKGLDLKN